MSEKADSVEDWSWVEDDTDWVPPPIDTTRPSVARIYDYLLGGKDNFDVDRQAAEGLAAVIPGIREGARANRDFMTATVQQMAEAGIDQFLDLGTGIPTSPNVHEVARAVHPDARVVYVDNDPVVTAHNRALLADDPHLVTLAEDLRDPVAVMRSPQLRQVLDLDRPVGLLMIAVWHFVDHGSAPAIATSYYQQLAPGSWVALSAATRDGVAPEALATIERIYASSSAPFHLRTKAQVEELFDGLTLRPPGIHDVFRSTHARGLAGIAVR